MMFRLQFHITMNYCLSFQEHSKIFDTRIFVFSLFFDVFGIGANKEDLLHVTHCIISLLSFSKNQFISKLFQHVMSLTYEHVLFN
jgi:hypothetical protein